MHESLWAIPIQNLCHPYLHSLPGKVKRQNDLLQKGLHEVALEIATEIEMSKAKLDNTLLHKYIQNLRSQRKLINEMEY